MKTILDFKDFTKGLDTSTEAPARPRPRTREPFGNFTVEDKRRQLVGQVARVIQELLNQGRLSDTDRRLLMIASAVKLLLDAA